MKKLIFIASIIFLLTACGVKEDSSTDPENSDNTSYPIDTIVKDGDFEYRLYSEQESYDEYAQPEIFAELTYRGEEDSIDIYHSASPFYFPVTERTRGFDIDYAMNDPLITTTLRKDEPLREKYAFAGGYNDTDSKAYVDFIEDFMTNGFPEGDYVVNGIADFFIEDPGRAADEEQFNLKVAIGFTVNKTE